MSNVSQGAESESARKPKRLPLVYLSTSSDAFQTTPEVLFASE